MIEDEYDPKDDEVCSADGDAEEEEEGDDEDVEDRVPPPKPDEEKKAGDEGMGAWVYCTQHVRPHSTGWCTVAVADKRPLKAQTQDKAYEETVAIGWPIFNSPEPLQRFEAEILKKFPSAKTELDVPKNRHDGTWWLDVKLDGHPLTVSYRYEREWGVSSTDPSRTVGLGEAADEKYDRMDLALVRSRSLLGLKLFTKEPQTEEEKAVQTGARSCSYCGKPHDKRFETLCSDECKKKDRGE